MEKLIKAITSFLLVAVLCMPAYSRDRGPLLHNTPTGKTTSDSENLVKKDNNGHKYLPTIDHRARTFYIDNIPYYCYNGTYYHHVSGKGFEEIKTPQNLIFEDLPYGARRVSINGYNYYNADGMWFQPIEKGFLLVEQPQTSKAEYNVVPDTTYRASFGF